MPINDDDPVNYGFSDNPRFGSNCRKSGTSCRISGGMPAASLADHDLGISLQHSHWPRTKPSAPSPRSGTDQVLTRGRWTFQIISEMIQCRHRRWGRSCGKIALPHNPEQLSSAERSVIVKIAPCTSTICRRRKSLKIRVNVSREVPIHSAVYPCVSTM